MADKTEQAVKTGTKYLENQSRKAAMTPEERKKCDRITGRLNVIEQELEAASNYFKQGRKTDAARLYVACGEAFVKMQAETQDDPLFVEALKARVKDCV